VEEAQIKVGVSCGTFLMPSGDPRKPENMATKAEAVPYFAQHAQTIVDNGYSVALPNSKRRTSRCS
jgi:hypothetical protein